jgi:hypothetical protein
MSRAHFVTLEFIILGLFFVALIAERTTPAVAETIYPWCVQGEILQCYYATREQCELTADYHGFCVSNPDASSSNVGVGNSGPDANALRHQKIGATSRLSHERRAK